MRRSYDFSGGTRGRFFGRDLKFEHAPTTEIDRLEPIAREFFDEIFGYSFDDCLVTDESCVCFFVTDDTPPDFEERAREKYGFEWTHEKLVDVLRRIDR